jgi:hypothetical protein
VNEKHNELHERITAGRLLTLTAHKASEQLDSMSGWMLIGFGGAYTLVFANYSSLQQFVSAHSLHASLLLLLAAFVLGVIQRWLAATIAASAAGAKEAEKIGAKLAKNNISIDFKVVFHEMEKGIYYPARWLVRRSLQKASAGDFAASGRLNAALSQIQTLLVAVQAVFAIAAAIVVACGFKV